MLPTLSLRAGFSTAMGTIRWYRRPEIALEDLKQIAEELADVGVIEQAPRMEGRTMFMVLTPIKK